MRNIYSPEVTTAKEPTIEGLPATVGKPLHPMQEAWLEIDVAQCGYCQPGQIMAAVALVKEAKAAGRAITEAELDTLRNICRCGTDPRIREAIRAGAARMSPATFLRCELSSRDRAWGAGTGSKRRGIWGVTSLLFWQLH